MNDYFLYSLQIIPIIRIVSIWRAFVYGIQISRYILYIDGCIGYWHCRIQ